MTGARMVDVSAKPVVLRRATAEGDLLLAAATIAKVKARSLEKGDALEIARTAAILAAKKTPELLPLCHPIPLEGITVDFDLKEDRVTVRVSVEAHWKTGVEMEAITAASIALLTVWDLAKPHEKDAQGQYPNTRIENLHVVTKEKGR